MMQGGRKAVDRHFQQQELDQYRQDRGKRMGLDDGGAAFTDVSQSIQRQAGENRDARQQTIDRQFDTHRNQRGQVQLPREHTYESQQTFDKAFDAAMQGHHVDIAPMSTRDAYAYVSNIEYDGRRLNYTAEQKAEVLNNMGIKPDSNTDGFQGWVASGNTVAPSFRSTVEDTHNEDRAQRGLERTRQSALLMSSSNQQLRQFVAANQGSPEEVREASRLLIGRTQDGGGGGISPVDAANIQDTQSRILDRRTAAERDNAQHVTTQQRDNINKVFDGNSEEYLRYGAIYGQVRSELKERLGLDNVPESLANAATSLNTLEQIMAVLRPMVREQEKYSGRGLIGRTFNRNPNHFDPNAI